MAELLKKVTALSAKPDAVSIAFASQLLNTYNRIAVKISGAGLAGSNLDLGSGKCGFSAACKRRGIESHAIDYPKIDLEKDKIPFHDNSIDFVTMNAVLEHLRNPNNVILEVKRVLKEKGLFFIRTPNWQRDYKNFYNNPNHIKPYTPISLRTVLELFGLTTLFLEPGLVEKSWFWWNLPGCLKWRVASYLHGGTKSIIAVAGKFTMV